MNSNIVLIGISGAGKTVIGRALSYKLQMPFFDLDSFIEEKNKLSIPEIFSKYGEEYFRKLESEAVKFLSTKCNNTIISTGGGVVLNEENMNLLKETGTVVYINRSLENILTKVNTNKRPLLKTNPQLLYDIYKKRHPLYLGYADICVVNRENFTACVDEISEIIKARMS